MIKSSAAVYTAITTKWKEGGPPARPTPFELKRIFIPYIKWLSKRRPLAKMLVLGATPEFRDLGLKYGMEVWAADINPNMLQAMDQLMKYKKAKGNKKIVADWIEMSKALPLNYFDLIIAEQSFNILLINEWGTLCKEIIKVSNKDGFVLLKFTTVPSKRKHALPAIFKFRKSKMTAGDLAFILHFAPEVGAYQPAKNKIDLKKQPAYLDRFLEKNVITKEQWQKHEKKIGAIQRGGITLYALSKGKTTKILRRYFKILKISHGRDFQFCQDMNIYWGKIRNK